MSTTFQHRIILIVPVAKVAAVVAWLTANVDASTDANLGPGLNVSGKKVDPITHRWHCAAWTDAQCLAILTKLCQLASVTPPTAQQWAGWTQAQKIAWLHGVQAGMKAGYGIWVTLAGNTGVWDSPTAALTAMSLKTATG